ncbi:MAG: stage II sporulation protein R [Candidatus Limivicinus sp.]
MFKVKRDSLKIWEISLLFALSVALCLGTWAQGRQSELSQKLVRLHVIAASDEAAEQALKLQVRDAVLEYLSPRLAGASDIDQAQAILRQELESIQLVAEGAAQGRSVTVTLGKERYPTKHYEGFTLPAGKYDSLRITLGQGQGHNWWCIVFPPVCLSASQSDTVARQLGEEDFRLISDGQGYELRFKVLELWGQLVG